MNIKAFEYYNDNYDLYFVYKNANSVDTDMLANHSYRTHEMYYLREGQRNFFINDELLSKYALEFYYKKSGFNIKMYEHSLSFLNEAIDLFDKGNSVSYSEKITHTQRAVVEIIKYIENYAADNLSLEFLSEKFFISPCHLSRSFKMIADMSLHDYISKVRLNKAKSLLDNHREKSCPKYASCAASTMKLI